MKSLFFFTSVLATSTVVLPCKYNRTTQGVLHSFHGFHLTICSVTTHNGPFPSVHLVLHRKVVPWFQFLFSLHSDGLGVVEDFHIPEGEMAIQVWLTDGTLLLYNLPVVDDVYS